MQIPKFLQKLMSSPAYADKDSQEYAKATQYMQLLYPGKVSFDVTGRMIQPEYDMTIEEFEYAQRQIDYEIQRSKKELEKSLEYESDKETESENADNEDDEENSDFIVRIVVKELLNVRVRVAENLIVMKQLKIYGLDVIENSDENEPSEMDPDQDKSIYVWCDSGECTACAAMAGTVVDGPNDVPALHPNCGCYAVLLPWSDFQERFGGINPDKQKRYRELQKMERERNGKTDANFERAVSIKEGQYAIFDGKSLTIYQDGKVTASWNAVSGKDGFQTPEYQNVKGKGTIPEGTYVARQEKLQYITSYGLVVGLLNKGTWPGSLYSWGSSRIALEASKETNTFDRGGFYVHGGWEPGSNGCIDLTSQMDDFTKWFENNGHDLIINVKYQR